MQINDCKAARTGRARWVRVWDLPTRLFHWSLVLLVVLSIYTGNVGGLREMDLHKLSGYAILALVLFRLVWGVTGSPRSRFADFVADRGLFLLTPDHCSARHIKASPVRQPDGGVVGGGDAGEPPVPAVTGLFARDDILTAGPLVRYVSKETSRTLTAIHELNATVLYVLIGLHLAAVFGYLIFRKNNLIKPMLTGRKAATAEIEGLVRMEPTLAAGSQR